MKYLIVVCTLFLAACGDGSVEQAPAVPVTTQPLELQGTWIVASTTLEFKENGTYLIGACAADYELVTQGSGWNRHTSIVWHNPSPGCSAGLDGQSCHYTLNGFDAYDSLELNCSGTVTIATRNH